MNEHPISLLRASRPHGALFIAGIYLLLGSLWILVSDPLAELVSTNADMLTTISILKGWCYVLVTALLLYWLIRRETATLRERESQLRLVTDAVPALIAYFDSQERLGFHNRVFDQWCGDLRGSPADQTLQALLGPERYAPLAGYVRTALSGKESSFESGLTCPGGPPRDLQISLIPDRDEEGLVKGFFTLAADITGRKREETEREELLAENQRHKALLDSIFEADPSALAVLEGPEKRIVFANPAYRFIVPDISQDPLGRPYAEIWPPDSGQGYHKEIQQVIERGTPFKVSGFERIFADDTRLVFNVQGRRIAWGEQPACLLTLWDITDQENSHRQLLAELANRQKAENDLKTRNQEIQAMTQQLWQTSKLATMGELAASVAHEINNPLAILSLRVESLSGSLPEALPERSDLAVMEQEIDRMAGLVSNLLQFSRSGEKRASSLDIRAEISQTLELMHSHMVHRRITIREDFSPATPLVIADRQQMRQVFLNLFTNAADAMPDGGELALRTGPGENGASLAIEIEDSGMGIPADTLPHVMDPFFTTKPERKGTGLGLAISRRIIEEHQGSLQISSPGRNQGTTVRIVLPCAAGGKPGPVFDLDGA